ncbi:MAG: hypothetical protein K0Q50_218 [Vampirovibrio sp.]|jgi:hypothetical protein|nr:hypothetical protein [Vampirovibrio sp.]
MPIGFSKDQQLRHYNERKQAKSAKQKGIQAEKSVQAEFQSTSKKPVRRNHQGKHGGGISNSDVSMHGWSLEVKNTERLSIPEWLRTLKKETPVTNKPALVFTFEEEQWIAIKLKDRLSFAADQVEAAGGEVTFH